MSATLQIREIFNGTYTMYISKKRPMQYVQGGLIEYILIIKTILLCLNSLIVIKT